MSTSFIENSEINQANPSILVHHQIKGARWGVHRGPPYPLENGIHTRIKRKGAPPLNKEKGRSNKRTTNKISQSSNTTKKASELSNEELRERIERFRLMSEYDKYTKEISNGQKFLTRMNKTLDTITITSNKINNAIAAGRRTAILFGLITPDARDKKPDEKKKSGS